MGICVGDKTKHNVLGFLILTQVNSGIVNTYTDLASTDWKARLGVHKTSFKHKPKPGAKSSNGTELSNHIWKHKDDSINYTLSWNILDRAKPFNPTTNMCRLCLTENYTVDNRPSTR